MNVLTSSFLYAVEYTVCLLLCLDSTLCMYTAKTSKSLHQVYLVKAFTGFSTKVYRYKYCTIHCVHTLTSTPLLPMIQYWDFSYK
jgi:hypothetical protein